MTGMIECRYYGRDFTADEMALLRALIAADPQPTRAALSREFCRRIGWFKPDGGLKDMMARVAMLAMHRDGVIALPPPKGRQYRPKPIVFGPETEPPLFPPPTTLDEVRTLPRRSHRPPGWPCERSSDGRAPSFPSYSFRSPFNIWLTTMDGSLSPPEAPARTPEFMPIPD